MRRPAWLAILVAWMFASDSTGATTETALPIRQPTPTPTSAGAAASCGDALTSSWLGCSDDCFTDCTLYCRWFCKCGLEL